MADTLVGHYWDEWKKLRAIRGDTQWLLAKLGDVRREATTTRDGASKELASELKRTADAKAALGQIETAAQGEERLTQYQGALVRAQNARGDVALAEDVLLELSALEKGTLARDAWARAELARVDGELKAAKARHNKRQALLRKALTDDDFNGEDRFKAVELEADAAAGALSGASEEAKALLGKLKEEPAFLPNAEVSAKGRRDDTLAGVGADADAVFDAQSVATGPARRKLLEEVPSALLDRSLVRAEAERTWASEARAQLASLRVALDADGHPRAVRLGARRAVAEDAWEALEATVDGAAEELARAKEALATIERAPAVMTDEVRARVVALAAVPKGAGVTKPDGGADNAVGKAIQAETNHDARVSSARVAYEAHVLAINQVPAAVLPRDAIHRALDGVIRAVRAANPSVYRDLAGVDARAATPWGEGRAAYRDGTGAFPAGLTVPTGVQSELNEAYGQAGTRALDALEVAIPEALWARVQAYDGAVAALARLKKLADADTTVAKLAEALVDAEKALANLLHDEAEDARAVAWESALLAGMAARAEAIEGQATMRAVSALRGER